MSKRHKDQAEAKHPWSRRPGESESAYRAFLIYRDLGESRTSAATTMAIREAYPGHGGKSGCGSGQVGLWSTTHKWLERARAWDNHLQEERDKVQARYAAKWEKRRHETLEKSWQIAETLQEKALKMLAMPLTTTTTERDGKAITIKAPRWTFGTAAEMAKMSADLKASILDAATRPAEQCTDAELKAIEDACHAAQVETVEAEGG